MKKRFYFVFYIILILSIAGILSILITILLTPFWSWFEASTGIESLGHSGPAEWCYVATFLIFVSIITATLLKYKLGKKRN